MNKTHAAYALGALLATASLAFVLFPTESLEQASQSGFPPDKYYQLRENPSYAIVIPAVSQNGTTGFTPREASIPAGMTVIWTNDDIDVHSVATVSNSTCTPPESFASKLLSPEGGTYIHSFNYAGTYCYVDGHRPYISGVIHVGNGMATGKHMNMMIGGLGVLPFNPSKPQGFVVSFVPIDTSIPPRDSMVYNVTVSNSTAKFYSHTYLTNSGILDLELLPHAGQSNNATSQFKTWGPDIIGQTGHTTTGTYHLQGPIMTGPTQYFLTVQIVSKDGKPVSDPPIVDQFILPPRANYMASTPSGVSSGNTTVSIVPYEGSNVSEVAPHQMPPTKSTITNPAP